MGPAKDLAQYLGMTKNGVLYMEKMGLIHSTVNAENGYKYYDIPAYITLAAMAQYGRMGMSTRQRLDMMTAEPQRGTELLESYRQELEKDYRAKLHAVETMDRRLERVHQFTGRVVVESCPMMCAIYDDFQTESSILGRWIHKMPDTMYGLQYDWDEEGRISFERCIFSEEEEADSSICVPEQECLYTVFPQGSLDEDIFFPEEVFRYARAHHIMVQKQGYGRVLYTQNVGKRIVSYTEIWLPIQKAGGR